MWPQSLSLLAVPFVGRRDDSPGPYYCSFNVAAVAWDAIPPPMTNQNKTAAVSFMNALTVVPFGSPCTMANALNLKRGWAYRWAPMGTVLPTYSSGDFGRSPFLGQLSVKHGA